MDLMWGGALRSATSVVGLSKSVVEFSNGTWYTFDIVGVTCTTYQPTKLRWYFLKYTTLVGQNVRLLLRLLVYRARR